MDLKLINKSAFTSGSTSGIEFATAKRLLNEGVQIIINGRTKRSVNKCVKELQALFKNGKISGIAYLN